MQFFTTAAMLVIGSALAVQTNAADTTAPRPASSPLPQAKPLRAARRNAGAAALKAETARPKVDIPPTGTVVTMDGVCPSASKTPCKTVITREELDRYIGAIPGANADARSRAAVQYARSTAMSSLARKQGLDKDPAVVRELEMQTKLLQTRILASAYMQNLQGHASVITGEEVQKYYDAHRDDYNQLHILRIAVPLAAPNETGRHLDPLAVKAEMDELHARAAQGEDLTELQKQAYSDLHIQATPPAVTETTVTRPGLQGDALKMFDLKEGEISPVLNLPAAFAIVKLVSRETKALDSVRRDIEAASLREHMQAELNRSTKGIKAEFNLEYLDLPSQPDLFAPDKVEPGPTVVRARMASPTPTVGAAK